MMLRNENGADLLLKREAKDEGKTLEWLLGWQCHPLTPETSAEGTSWVPRSPPPAARGARRGLLRRRGQVAESWAASQNIGATQGETEGMGTKPWPGQGVWN